MFIGKKKGKRLPSKQWVPQRWTHLNKGRMLCVWDAIEATSIQGSKQKISKSLSFLRMHDYKKTIILPFFPLAWSILDNIQRVHMGGFDSQRKERKERKKQESLGLPIQAFPLFQVPSHPKPTADPWGVLPVSEGWHPRAQKYCVGSLEHCFSNFKSHLGVSLKCSFWLSVSGVEAKILPSNFPGDADADASSWSTDCTFSNKAWEDLQWQKLLNPWSTLTDLLQERGRIKGTLEHSVSSMMYQ